MTTVLALDQSTQTGWTYAGDKVPLGEWISGRFKAPKRDEVGERLIIVEDSVLALIDRFQPEFIAYEEPWNPLRELLASIEDQRKGKEARGVRGGYNLKTINLLMQIKGAVLMAAARRSIATEGHTPRSWRTVLKLPKKPIGADNEWVKRETLKAVKRLGAQVRDNFDEADSWGLALYVLHGQAGVKRATQDLFDKVRETL